jgi:hypothetical protein
MKYHGVWVINTRPLSYQALTKAVGTALFTKIHVETRHLSITVCINERESKFTTDL